MSNKKKKNIGNRKRKKISKKQEKKAKAINLEPINTINTQEKTTTKKAHYKLVKKAILGLAYFSTLTFLHINEKEMIKKKEANPLLDIYQTNLEKKFETEPISNTIIEQTKYTSFQKNRPLDKLKIDDLIVIEKKNDQGQKNLYLLRKTKIDNLYHEYYGQFKAWYQPLSELEVITSDSNEQLVLFDSYIPLKNLLTHDCLGENPLFGIENGYIRRITLDTILSVLKGEELFHQYDDLKSEKVKTFTL